eukprot:m.37460 g.37460  ORF g.37460 m.37460 type:complete len:462 (-) comp10095_c0_seq1:67-1452(-)
MRATLSMSLFCSRAQHARRLARLTSVHQMQTASLHTTDVSAPSSEVLTRYSEMVSKDILSNNDAQIEVCHNLDTMLHELRESTHKSGDLLNPGLFASLLGQQPAPNPHPVKSCYIWGSVGSGKTMLMDMFYEACHSSKKHRTHFHEFMLGVHDRIHKQKAIKSGDPIPDIARSLMQEHSILCFDEFQVTDVADAVIIKRLFEQMFNRGLVMVATSNRKPDDLYKGGLQRPLFLPFIPLIKARANIVQLDSEEDYRLGGKLTPLEKNHYLTPVNPKTYSILNELFIEHTTHLSAAEPRDINIMNRTLHVPKCTGGVCWFSFDELCNSPRSAADYLELVRNFHTFFVSGIPQMTLQHKEAARRFITLIDCLYDHGARLACTAEVAPKDLFISERTKGMLDEERMLMDDLKLGDADHSTASIFTGEDETFAWSRTASRLAEMQSSEYWQLAEERGALAFNGWNS